MKSQDSAASMCSGIEYQDQLHLWQDASVRLPVLRRDGTVQWLPWGGRHGLETVFHQGPCARLESVLAGKWRRFSPRPVKILLSRYMERDARGRPYWVKVEDGQFLQGVLASHGGEQRVYVVTVASPPAYQHVQPRWPRVLPEPPVADVADPD